MFTTHFKMTGHPFREDTPCGSLLQDERVSQGLARLDYFAEAGSLALVTGTTGVGKSSLVRLFLAGLSKHRMRAHYVYLTHVNAVALLKLIVQSLGEAPRRGKERLFLQILEKTRSTEHTTLLVVDEAQYLEPEALTDLRLLVTAGAEDAPKLKILLAGQEGLRHQLGRASHADLVHRIGVRYHLAPLTRAQTTAYIDHHLKAAGASDKLFEPEAKDLIHDYAGGLPRQINNVATACLIHAAAENAPKITHTIVHQTLPEFQLA
jgi:general secretion pathway protein A